jgi:hypothetical protein
MKVFKYVSLVSKLSKIEGRKESLSGQQSHTLMQLRRGYIDEQDFLNQSRFFHDEMKSLESQKRTIIRHYLAA